MKQSIYDMLNTLVGIPSISSKNPVLDQSNRPVIDCLADYGGAVCGGSLAGSSLSMHFSRIINCSSSGKAIDTFNPVFDAANNWWGTNDDPSGFVSGNATVGPWLVLWGTADPSSITTSQTSVVRANLNRNSDGEDKSGSGHVPDRIAATFAVTGGSGSVSPSSGTTTDGAVATTFSPSTTGVATVGITVDGVLVSVPVTVSSPSFSGSGGGSNTNTGVGASENLKAGQSASFTFEGKGAVDGLSVTVGVDTPKIMVTVKSLSSLPPGVNEPGNEVYEYEEVTEYFVDSSGITGGEFGFRVSKSWLASNGYELSDIVMLHYNGETGVWEELETTFVREEGGYYYYSAATPSFSWFAIAVEEGATIVPEGTAQGTPGAAIAAGKTAESTTTVAGIPSETAVAADSNDSGGNSSWSSLAIPLLLVFLAVIVIAGIVCRKRKEEYPDWWNKEFK